MWSVMWPQSYASLFSTKIKVKEKKNQKKKNIKSRKIDKRKKNVSAQVHHNIAIVETNTVMANVHKIT